MPLRARPKRRRRCALPRALQNTVVLPTPCLRIHPNCKRSLQTDYPCERSLPQGGTPCEGFFAISSPRTDSITKHGRLGKLHVVPALAGPDRLKAGLHAKGPWLPAKQKSNSVAASFCGRNRDRGRNEGLNLAPPSEPDWRISRIRLSSRWSHL